MNVFDRSLFMRPGRVLGAQLRPFSAFHAAALNVIQSPFLEGGLVSWGDLVAAVLVCQSKRSDGLDTVLSFTNDLAEKLYWRVRTRFMNLQKESDKLNEHIAAYFDYPEGGSPRTNGKSDVKHTGAPWAFFVVSYMWTNTDASLEELWDMPLVELNCHKAIFDESNGGFEIGTSLLEERERNRRKNAKKKRDNAKN